MPNIIPSDIADSFTYKDGVLIRLSTMKAVGKFNGHSYQFKFKGKWYLVHRVVWFLHHGEIEDGFVIDHIDGDPSNNRIDNLRLATVRENALNRRVHSNNKLGIKGVCKTNGGYKWRAYLDNRIIGQYDTIDEAVTCVKAARALTHGEFTNHG